MVKKSLILLTFVLTFLCSLSHLSADTLAVVQGSCVEIGANGEMSDSLNISITYPKNLSLVVENQPMTKSYGDYFNYTFCNTRTLGTYNYQYFNSTRGSMVEESFLVTPTGDELTEGQSLLYLFMLIAMFFVFGVALYGAITLPLKNKRNFDNDVIKIEWKKYLKIFSIGMSYVTFAWIIFVSWNLAWGHLHMQGIGVFFQYMFYLLMAMSTPIFIGGVIFTIISVVNDNKIKKDLDKMFEGVY